MTGRTSRFAPFILVILAITLASAAHGQGQPTVAWVPNPTSGVQLFTLTFRPTNPQPGVRYPAIVYVPGGTGTNAAFSDANMQAQANLGFVTVKFDPDGRGQSTNGGAYTVEDFGGFIQQDGLHQILKYVAGRSDVDSQNIHVQSRSFGITMSAGALARYPHTPQVKSLVEWEGPADRSDTAGFTGHDIADNLWWFEHEPTNFVNQFGGDFIAVQSTADHVQPDHLHTIKLNNRAVNAASGGAGRTRFARVNGATGAGSNAANQVFQGTMLVSTIAETTALEPFLRPIMQEMAARPPRPRVGDLTGNGTVDAADLALILAAWDTDVADADLSDDGVVLGQDMAILLAGWGGGGGGGGGSQGPVTHDLRSASSADGLIWVKDNLDEPIIEAASVPCLISRVENGNDVLRSYFVDACDTPEHISTIVSTDGGATWSAREPIVVTGATTLKEVDPCAIVMGDGSIRLYYYATAENPGGPGSHPIDLAVGLDGVNFARVGTAFAMEGLVDPDVFAVADGWIMHVMALESGTVVAHSTDGLSFTQVGMLSPANYGVTAPVRLSGGGFRMYGFGQGVGGQDTFYSMTSPTGLAWTLEPGVRLDAPSDREITDPFVVGLPGGGWKMIYKTSPVGGQGTPGQCP
ncbi:MAG: hypothetical protein EXS03_08745 [Phycisphaerales bacterium]|nr:hypothetical protein [Phycisphaerales bacterium]